MHAPVHRKISRLAFADTDASGWMHFTAAFRYFEAAEHEFLASCGVLVFDRAQGGWPRVNVACDFLSPLVFHDEIETRLAILKIGTSSLTWGFEIYNLTAGKTASRGSVTTVRVDAGGKPVAISSEWRALLEPPAAL